jgi:hypothetical protein
MLFALGEDAEPLRAHHPENIEDVPLFAEIAKRSDIVFISTDTSQRTRKDEARALKQAGVTALYFGPFFERMKLWDQAAWLTKKWPIIKGFAEGVDKGTCAEIKHNGRALVFHL